MSETRDRFLRAIAERIPVDRIEEVYLFPALRQGGQESGVAVVAAAPEAVQELPGVAPDGQEVVSEQAEPTAWGGEPGGQLPQRLTIYRASYCLALKGSERGRWEVDVTAEADAPLTAVDDVVRGVHRRAGEDRLPERLTAEDFRAALAGATWTAAP
jgi:hypothetical protein